MSRLFPSGGQSIGASTSASILPMNIQGWFPLGLTGFISLLLKGLSRVFPTPQFESIGSSALSLLYGPALIRTWLLKKNKTLTTWTLENYNLQRVFTWREGVMRPGHGDVFQVLLIATWPPPHCHWPLLLLSRFSHVWLCATPKTAGHRASPSLGFSRQEHWSGLPFPSPATDLGLF